MATAAKTEKKSRAPRTPHIAFDYASVKVAEVDPPRVQRSSRVDSTPFPGLIAKCLETGKAAQIVIPAAILQQTENLIRTAASRADTGVRVQATEVAGTTNVTVTFSTKPKRAANDTVKPTEEAK